VDHLRVMLRNGRLPHALLFSGIEGVGKRTTALALAQACNCHGRLSPREETLAGCGACRPCRLIASGQHPDLHRVEPSGQWIRAEQVRDLLRALALRPHEARKRFVLLAEVDRLNPSAGNALLKLLEEPPPETLIVLTARQLSDLMPTIVSRCQRLTFAPLTEEALVSILTGQDRLEEAAARILAGVSAGSITRARQLAREGWLRRRNWLIDEFQAIASRSAGQRLALAHALASDRDNLAVALRVMQLWVRDLLLWPIAPHRIANRDRKAAVAAVASELGPAALLRRAEALGRAQQDLAAGANPRLAIDALMLSLAAA
jgi:DNA polymerase-3 subunit delta'